MPSLVLLARFSHSRVGRAIYCVLIFLASFCFSQFFYDPSGPDQFFTSLTRYYVSAGHIDRLFEGEYWQPAFFVLDRVFGLVTGIPHVVYEHVFLLLCGVLIALGVFLIMDRRGIDSGAGLFAFSILTIEFLVYQFAPQTLSLSLVFLMIAAEFALPKSTSRWLAQLVIFVSTCFMHAFLAVIYVLYVFFSAGVLREQKARRIVMLGAIYASVLLFYTRYFFADVLGILYTTLLQWMGLGEFKMLFATTLGVTPDPLVRLFSRATIIGMGLISVWGLFLMAHRREFTSKDLAVGMAGGVYVILGFPLPILGWRALQFLGITGGLGGGYFGGMKGKWRTIILVILAVSSVSIQMHTGYNVYLFRNPISAQQVAFISTHFDQDGTTVYMEDKLSDIFRYETMNRGLDVLVITELTETYGLTSYDYYAIGPELLHNSESQISLNSLPAVPLVANRIINDGMNWWVMSVSE
jgi:hypothetical protein